MILRIVLIIVFVLLVLTAIRKFVFNWLQRKMLTKVENRFAGRRIAMMAINANFFGQRSKGGKQVRGNGALVLTETELWFCQAMPEKEISIPVNQIKAIELRRSFLGRSIFRQLLYVEFYHQGRDESIAWYVNDPEKWKMAIDRLINED
ncbi:MAG: hypothetical protein GY839_15155 [candidate division Zixibacteria bacterium]|nr:hypothetical protein [candidate division Zixibacteria bacterium]